MLHIPRRFRTPKSQCHLNINKTYDANWYHVLKNNVNKIINTNKYIMEDKVIKFSYIYWKNSLYILSKQTCSKTRTYL